MNYTLIILGVILLIVIYILYTVINGKDKVISKKVDLTVSQPAIPYEKNVATPNSSRYYFSFWVYVEKLNPSANTDILYISKTASGNGDQLKIFVDSSSNLKYKIDGTGTDQEIMTNFPLQKWVFLVFSIDNKIVDLYVDGKLIRSQMLTTAPTTPTKSFYIQYPSCVQCKVYIAKLEREPQPMDPSTAWKTYMKGNGGNYFSKMLSSYGAKLTLTKDDLDSKEFSLF